MSLAGHFFLLCSPRSHWVQKSHQILLRQHHIALFLSLCCISVDSSVCPLPHLCLYSKTIMHIVLVSVFLMYLDFFFHRKLAIESPTKVCFNYAMENRLWTIAILILIIHRVFQYIRFTRPRVVSIDVCLPWPHPLRYFITENEHLCEFSVMKWCLWSVLK